MLATGVRWYNDVPANSESEEPQVPQVFKETKATAWLNN
jgi:hypothetical protein